MELLEHLKTALSHHDWYYDYSDDYSVYRKGRDNAARIQSLLRQCHAQGQGEAAEKMYQAAQPKRF